MSDLAAVIEGVLGEHRYGAYGVGTCLCGWVEDRSMTLSSLLETHRAHVATVLAERLGAAGWRPPVRVKPEPDDFEMSAEVSDE